MSQTRVCDTTQPRRLHPPTHPHGPLRIWPEVSPKTALLRCHLWGWLAGFNSHIIAVSDLPPTRCTLAPPLTGLTCGLQVIEGLHRAGVEFRSLAEEFDTSTANGKLQLSMVLAFSEWWRNSIRERSMAGQAKARAEGRFPGRRPSLTEQKREYIRVERSKGVSQRELAKLLEVSRWTIQQVDG